MSKSPYLTMRDLDAFIAKNDDWMNQPIEPNQFVVHPCWVEDILKTPGLFGLSHGDELYSMEKVNGPLTRVFWERV
jgi:hypothetical protein